MSVAHQSKKKEQRIYKKLEKNLKNLVEAEVGSAGIDGLNLSDDEDEDDIKEYMKNLKLQRLNDSSGKTD